MGDFIQAASAILARSEQRLEASAQNIANMTTPGYKRVASFDRLVAQADGGEEHAPATTVDFSEGKPIDTGGAFDLAVLGDGFFAVRSPDGIRYTRQGQFRLDADGVLVDLRGFPVQGEGGDIRLKTGVFKVRDDGVVLDDGQPAGKLSLVSFADHAALSAVGANLFTGLDDAGKPAVGARVRQGALESSNVSTGDEMVAMMEAIRRAQSGQKLVNLYDDLMGRAISVFGQSG